MLPLGEFDRQYRLHLLGNLRLYLLQIRVSARHWPPLTLRCLHLYVQVNLPSVPLSILYRVYYVCISCALQCLILRYRVKRLIYFGIFLGSIILRSPINWSRVLVRDIFTNYLSISYKSFT
jgi:hypothetical protein